MIRHVLRAEAERAATILVAAGIAIAGCGGEPNVDTSETTTQPGEALGSTERSADWIQIGDARYVLTVRSCNLSGSDDAGGGNTVNAVATKTDGTRRGVEVSRIGNSQAVMLSLGGSDRWEAEWSAGLGGSPLVEVDGKVVKAAGTFRNGEQEAQGSLHATCP